MNTVSEPVSVCPVEQNISVSAYLDVPFQGLLEFLKKLIIYIYIFLYNIKLSIQINKYQIIQSI